ncbi:hypothetical protein BGZ54_006961 [Gamsiella multidivaricata]|nr:hypothetical protein BGZ54_006961 [Gamsiella multidivaricata]
MPFRAAKKVVTSVTSVGSGLLPSKEQLGSIPVAGRILKHPVMDSTLTYIASKTTQRGAGAGSKAISPEDVHYRKLNKKLVDQAITLSALAIEREDQSKTIDDEAGDDAFELYLAAIAMLMHALPIETCDPLRREAFESQLRNFLQENQLDGETENDINSKQLRRRRRRRHREHLDQATSLIYQHSGAIASISSSSNAPHSPQGAQRKQRHGKSGHRSRNSCRGRRGKDADNAGPTLGEAIVATAVESAIRLKQSPIPDAIKTCYHASRTIFSKMDERFHIQDRAWQLSKQSIEKAIELDEQYAIHEVMTETFFATVTGLVKAGIAYKETPSYSTVKALVTQQHQSQDEVQAALPALEAERSHNPQTIVDYKEASSPSFTRRYSVITEEDEESTTVDDGTEAYDREIDESSSSEYASSDDEDDEGEVGNKFGRKHGRNPFEARRYGLFSQTAASALPGPYTDQTQQRVGLVMALRGAASLFMSGLASK